MRAAGIFSEDDRVELLAGEIMQMTPSDSRHAACADRLNRILISRLGAEAIVGVQSPVHLDDRSEPQPDVTVLRPKRIFTNRRIPVRRMSFCSSKWWRPSGEVDPQAKLPLFSKAGIPEVWIVDVAERVLEVYRWPSSTGYQETRQIRGAD